MRTCLLNHPNGATGYRIEHGGGSICYVTDTEHVEGTHDENILSLIDGADVFIYDATYTPIEYPNTAAGDIRPGRKARRWPNAPGLALMCRSTTTRLMMMRS